jgi:DNA-binding NtrC family response regulator/ABC-type branched-subunit amino acid transport system substrate-binding protein
MIKKIGLLFSLSGTISIVGEGQLQAALLAIEEVNKTSNIQFQSVIRDDKSDPCIAAHEAYNLFKDSNIDILVGCYMSSLRNAIKPVLNETGGLLIYPTLYEGEHFHPNIFYLGAVPNQQVEPLLSWAINNVSSNFVLVGSDYVYPRSTNRQVRQWIENAGGKVYIETYFSLGCAEFGNFFQTIRNLSKKQSSFVVFSTIVGDSVVSFYKEYKRKQIPFPIISPITSEREIQSIGKEASYGHICTSAYFQTLNTEANNRFKCAFKRRFGEQPISREMAATYDSIRMLALGYSRLPPASLKKIETETFRTSLKNLSFQGIQGKVLLDSRSQHLWQWSRIGRVNPEGQIEAFWESSGPIPPNIDTSKIALNIGSNSGRCEVRNFCSLVGVNPTFLNCIQLAKICAKTSSSVLITGETGTGKELFARAIHKAGSRYNFPFVPINCATIPRDLIESELFGYEEGAFTGARKGGKAGKFEIADGGTLFLDEIGEMAVDMQAHLLRAIEEKEIYRVGGTEAVRLNVRLIASSNKDLSREITQSESFRKDLFYRLSVFHIKLPKLCERIDDISYLANHFLKNLCRENSIEKKLGPETLKILESHLWPGNVRELSNVIEMSFYSAMDSELITPDHLPGYIVNRQPVSDEKSQSLFLTDECNLQNLISPNSFPNHFTSIKKSEEYLIKQILSRCSYNMNRASLLLGISRGTLYRKIKKYGIITKRDYLTH